MTFTKQYMQTTDLFSYYLIHLYFVSNVGANDMLYDETQLAACYDKIETVDYHQEMNVDGIKFTGYNAGHVLGAAMFLIEIAGIKVLHPFFFLEAHVCFQPMCDFSY